MMRAFAAAVVLVAGSATGQVEISEDGRTLATLEDFGGAGASVIEGSGVPFGTEPDWQNALRRQVGALEIADMNGDGFNDLVVGCYISNSFPPYDFWQNLIYFGTGSGLEAEPGWVSDDQVSTTDIKIGDINLDGFPDIYASNGGSFSDSVIYFGSADGPSTSPGWVANEPEPTFSLGVAIFDVENDGDLDVITTNQGLNPDPFRRMYMFINDNGTLPTVPSWESDERSIQNSIAIADYDGDGFDDVFVTKWANFETAIHRNNGGVLDTDVTWTTGRDTTDRGAAAADFDGDGKVDFVVGRSGSANPSQTYRNTSTGPTPVLSPDWTSGAPFIGIQDIRAADVDGDGDADIGEVHFSDGRAHIYLNHGGVLSTAPDWTYDASQVGTAIVFGDLNSDGVTDVAVGYSGDVSIRVFYGEAAECLADTNGDGELTPADFNAWIAAFNSQSQACDQNGDGLCNPSDFNAWIANFNLGC
ncbi:MAG: VCBS repeat-containing protein [Planctomycetota bacterium]